MSLDARMRKFRIQIQTRAPVEDSYGQEDDNWTPLGEEYASISFGTGVERREAAQDNASAPATFSILANQETNRLSVTDRICYPISDPDPEKWPAWDITSIVPAKDNPMKGWDITAVSATK